MHEGVLPLPLLPEGCSLGCLLLIKGCQPKRLTRLALKVDIVCAECTKQVNATGERQLAVGRVAFCHSRSPFHWQ